MDKILTGDPETCSVDMLAENLNGLKLLFPDAFTEGKVDFDVLRQLLGNSADDNSEKFGLNWHGKRRARQLALTPSSRYPSTLSRGQCRLGHYTKSHDLKATI